LAAALKEFVETYGVSVIGGLLRHHL